MTNQTLELPQLNAPVVSRTCLYSAAELETVLDAMAARIAAALKPGRRLVLIGVLRRGAPLADRLTQRLVQQHGVAQPLRLDLKVQRYADDLTLLHPETRLEENAQLTELDLRGCSLWVVDDVLYEGHSLLKVVAYLSRKQPAEIRFATLVDRCVSRLPVHADVVGVRLEVAPADVLECHVPPYEPDFQIERVRRHALPSAPLQAAKLLAAPCEG